MKCESSIIGSVIIFVFFVAGCGNRSVCFVEKSKNGDYSISSRDRVITAVYLKSDPEHNGPMWGVSVDGLPTTSYYGLGGQKQPKYSEFFAKGLGWIYDKNLDGIPDEAVTTQGKRVALEIWSVDQNGNRRNFSNYSRK